MEENMREEYLGGGITAFITPEHGFGTDAVLLADFAAPTPKNRCCDLGTGCGIIPLLWCRRPGIRVTGVDIQPLAVRQFAEAIEKNSLQERASAVECDLREIRKSFANGSFDLVTMNPPYKAEGTGIISDTSADRIARHGTQCTFDDLCTAAAWLLNYSGRLCVCLRPERLCEMFCAMRENGIEPKRLRLVGKTSDSVPWLALVEGRRGGKPGMTVEAQFAVYDGEEYSPAMKKIYGDYLFENREVKP